jgi:hypothetical protein
MPTDTAFDIEGLSVSAFEVDPAGRSDEESLTSGYGLTEVGASSGNNCSCCCVSTVACCCS